MIRRAPDNRDDDAVVVEDTSTPGPARPRRLGRYVFKQADTPDEFDQIHRLNCRTFVHEIGQHPQPAGDRLIDPFEHKNVYFIGLRGNRVVGMVAVHSQPPFSVAKKLARPERLEALGHPLLEARLLAVEQSERFGTVAIALLWLVHEHARRRGIRHIVISGVGRQLRIYGRIGFRPIGPPVTCGEAQFTPMCLDLETLPGHVRRVIDGFARRLRPITDRTRREVLLQPGPVEVSPAVRRAFAGPGVSHRDDQFIAMFERVRRTLREMTGADHAALTVGSGTLANDAIAATLRATPNLRHGLILVNGEFGSRLLGQARSIGLEADALQWPWGDPWDADELEDRLAHGPPVDWIWGVHLETSTGMINDVDVLCAVAKRHDVRICLDCVSSLGAVPVDLGDVHLASGSSGKSLGAYAGLAIVLAADEALVAVDHRRTLPSYLNVPDMARTRGTRFTVASPLVAALAAALEPYDDADRRRRRFEHCAALGQWVRRRLGQLGATLIVDGERAAPTVTSFTPPPGYTPAEFVAACRDLGYHLGGLSDYLRQRAWLQIATMGDLDVKTLQPLFAALQESSLATNGRIG